MASDPSPSHSPSITFDIDPSLPDVHYRATSGTLSSHFSRETKETCLIKLHSITKSHFIDETHGGFHNGFFNAIFEAYSYHIPLTLSPDNFWYQIMQEVARHINMNSDKFKHLISDATEKPLIDVDITEKTFDDGIGMIVESLRDMVKDRAITELCVTPFSTTTPLIQNCYGSVLMNMMQSYFGYQMSTRCGIKRITLQGNESDWLNLYNRVEKLRTMPYADGIEPNLDLMLASLSKILNCFKGEIDKDFWNQIIAHDHGSGYDYVTGWIVDFFIYDIKNKKIREREAGWGSRWVGVRRALDTELVPAGYSTTPFIWNNIGVKHNMIMYGGQSGIQVLPDKSITPAFVTVFAETNDSTADKVIKY